MADSLTALGAGIAGSVLTFLWQKVADRRKDAGVRRQLRSMLRMLLQRCVYQTVGGPNPPFKLAEYLDLSDGLIDRANKDDVPTALSDQQADAVYEAVQNLAQTKRRVTEHFDANKIAVGEWIRLPDSFKQQQEAEIAQLAFALIALGDDLFVDSQIPEPLKTTNYWRIYVDDAFAVYRLPTFIHRVARWGSRKRRWRGFGIQVDGEGRMRAQELSPLAQRIRKWLG